MIDNGYCDNITEDDIDAMTEVLKPYLNVKVNYEQAKKITGKTDSAFNSKISRCGLKPTKERLYRYIDMVKIKLRKFEWLVSFMLVIIKYAHPLQGWVSFLY